MTRTSHSRYMTDFEEYEVGDTFTAMDPEGGAATRQQIIDYDGKKALYSATGYQWMEFYPFGKGGGTAARSNTLSEGYFHVRFKIKPATTPFVKINGYTYNYPAIHVRLQYGDTFEAVIKETDGGDILDTLVFSAAPGADPVPISVAFDVGMVRVTVGTETLTYSASPFGDINWVKVMIYPDVTTTWIDMFGSSLPLLMNVSGQYLNIDGEEVIGAAVKLWDTTLSPPDYTITSGIGGTLDLSGVSNGDYYMIGISPFGDSFYRYVTITDGEIS